MTRRELLQTDAPTVASPRGDAAANDASEWIRSARALIAEGYNAAFFPKLTYDPDRAPRITRSLNADALHPEYAGWCKRHAEGKPMITAHYGYGLFYQGCVNSPVRARIAALVREVVTREMIRGIRNLPVIYNDIGLPGRHEARSGGYSVLDGFMIEHPEAPEQKLLDSSRGR